MQSNFFPAPQESGLKIANITNSFIERKTITRPSKMVLRAHDVKTLMLLLTSPRGATIFPHNLAGLASGMLIIPNAIQPRTNAAKTQSAANSDEVELSQGPFYDLDNRNITSELIISSAPQQWTRTVPNTYLRDYLKNYLPQINGTLLFNHYKSQQMYTSVDPMQSIPNNPTGSQNITSPCLVLAGPLYVNWHFEYGFGSEMSWRGALARSSDINSGTPTLESGGALSDPYASNTRTGTPSFNSVGEAAIFDHRGAVTLAKIANATPGQRLQRNGLNVIEFVERPTEERDIFWLQPGDIIQNATCTLTEFNYA